MSQTWHSWHPPGHVNRYVAAMANLSVHDAATRLATSDRTVRRYLASGQLAGTRTVDGWTVSAEDLDRFLATRTVSASGNGHMAADTSAGMTALVALVDRLQRENRDLAGLVGSLQERTANLEAQLALPASAEIAPQRDSEHAADEPTQQASAPRRRWWRVW